MKNIDATVFYVSGSKIEYKNMDIVGESYGGYHLVKYYDQPVEEVIYIPAHMVGRIETRMKKG